MALLLVPQVSLEAEILATAVPRDLVRGGFAEPISVLSRYPDVWRHNRFVRDVFTDSLPPGHKVLRLPPLHDGKDHLLVRQMDYVAAVLRVDCGLTELRPHLAFSKEESERVDAPSCMQGKPYWCMCVSLDHNWPTAWWATCMWQQATHCLSGDPEFPLVLQVGIPGAHTPEVRDCLSLVDMVSLRELMWLVRHSRGVLTGPGPLVHIAAACLVPSVVVLGGALTPSSCTYDRAAIHAALPNLSPVYRPYEQLLAPSQVFDAIGQLPCCQTGGCRRGAGCVDMVEFTLPGTQRFRQPRCLHALHYRKVVDSAQTLERNHL
jgi:hypothetical protein